MHIKNKHQNSVVLVPFISLKQHKQIQPINYKSYNLYINPFIQLHAHVHYTKEHITLHQSEHNITLCFLKFSSSHGASFSA